MKEIELNKIYTLILISAIIAPIVSTIITSLITNIFQTYLRKSEMRHEKNMHLMELSHKLTEKSADFTIKSKYDVFNQFVENLSLLFSNYGDKEKQLELYASTCKVASLCSNDNNRKIIMNFANSISEIYGKSNFTEFQKQLDSISKVIQSEFSASFTFHIENMK